MDCSHVTPLLDEYFEGTLPPHPTAEIHSHLSACPRCTAELRQIEKIATALESIPRVAPTSDLLRSISLRTAELPAPAARRTATGWRWLAVVASLFMAGIGLIGYLLPLLISGSLASSFSLAQCAEDAAVVVRSWLGAAPGVSVALWDLLTDFTRGCSAALHAAAPTLGLYAAAEIGILLALVLVLHASRRKRPARQMMVI